MRVNAIRYVKSGKKPVEINQEKGRPAGSQGITFNSFTIQTLLTRMSDNPDSSELRT
jgi:hypothetical protein